MLFDIEPMEQLILFRFLLYILLPSILTALIASYSINDDNSLHVIFLPIAVLTALALIAVSGFVGGPISLIGELYLHGRDKLSIVLISSLLAMAIIFFYELRVYFITNPQKHSSSMLTDGRNLRNDVNIEIHESDKNPKGQSITGVGKNKEVNINEVLLETLILEGQASRRYKFVILNIFLVINIVFIGFYIFKPEKLDNFELGAISATYISLSMFMVYIFRISNARLTTILSIQEDLYKKNRFDDYIERLNKDVSPSDNDIEIIRMLLINRSERERPTSHPYEILMKGISNSNIQLKGGKLEASAGSDKLSVK